MHLVCGSRRRNIQRRRYLGAGLLGPVDGRVGQIRVAAFGAASAAQQRRHAGEASRGQGRLLPVGALDCGDQLLRRELVQIRRRCTAGLEHAFDYVVEVRRFLGSAASLWMNFRLWITPLRRVATLCGARPRGACRGLPNVADRLAKLSVCDRSCLPVELPGPAGTRRQWVASALRAPPSVAGWVAIRAPSSGSHARRVCLLVSAVPVRRPALIVRPSDGR